MNSGRRQCAERSEVLRETHGRHEFRQFRGAVDPGYPDAQRGRPVRCDRAADNPWLERQADLSYQFPAAADAP